MGEKEVLFWDFHGTLTTPDVNWFTAASEAAKENVPETSISDEIIIENLTGKCLPWFTIKDRDTRHIAGSKKWWAYCENQFFEMYLRCGLSKKQAQKAVPFVRKKVLHKNSYNLCHDAKFVLEKTKNAGYKNFLLSNNFPELSEITKALGINIYFEEEIISGVSGFEKPRPEIFSLAYEIANCPKKPVMIGDNPIDDIEGAKKAGFKTIAVHNANAPMADYIVNELSEILDIFGIE